jgi:hypothetical protein
MDGQLAAITISPHRYHRGIKRGWGLNQLLGSKPSFLHLKSGLNRKQEIIKMKVKLKVAKNRNLTSEF